MHIRTISGKGGFPPDVGAVLTASVARTQLRAKELADMTVLFLKQITPVRTGLMRGAAKYWNLRIYGNGNFVFWFGWQRQDFIGKVFYPPYVDEGTGIYGKRRSRIYPIRARRLAWQYRGKWKSAPSIAGQRPQRLLSHAYRFANKKLRAMYQSEVLMGMKRTFK